MQRSEQRVSRNHCEHEQGDKQKIQSGDQVAWCQEQDLFIPRPTARKNFWAFE